MKHPTALRALLPILILAACDDDTGLVGTTPPPDEATVRFVNATVDAGPLNFLAGNGPIANNVGAGQASPCVEVEAGTTELAFASMGTTTPIATRVAELTDDDRFTVVAVGTSTDPDLLVLSDVFTAPSAGRARLRVVNAMPTGGAVDVFVSEPDAELTTPTQTNVTFNTTQTFLDVPSGMTQLRVTGTGTTTPIIDTGSFTLAEGQVHTVLLTQQEDGTLGFSTVDLCS